MGLPAAVVVAGFTTLFIALNNPHSMVDDAYYQEGLAINESLEQDTQAAQLNMGAQVFFEPTLLQVRVNLQGQDLPAQMELRLMHPMSDQFDQVVSLQRDAEGVYHGTFTTPTQTSYYLRLTPPEAGWRLNGEVDFRFGTQVLLSSQ
jgi:hypothetical protein